MQDNQYFTLGNYKLTFVPGNETEYSTSDGRTVAEFRTSVKIENYLSIFPPFGLKEWDAVLEPETVIVGVKDLLDICQNDEYYLNESIWEFEEDDRHYIIMRALEKELDSIYREYEN